MTAPRRAPRKAALVPLLAVGALVVAAGAAVGAPSISVHGYDDRSGNYHPVAEGGTIPNGSTLHLRIYIDLYSCGDVRVGWGDGTPAQTRSYGGALVLDWAHPYNKEGTYGIVANDCDGGDGAAITVGGAGGSGEFGLGPLDPASDMFVAAMLSLILALMGLAFALGHPPVPPAPPVQQGPVRPSWWKSLQPGVPASRVWHIASLRDIPIGAPRQREPRLQMAPGEPTDLLEKQFCPDCSFPLGYTVAGWFCLNPKCPRIEQAERTAFPDVGGSYGPPHLETPRV